MQKDITPTVPVSRLAQVVDALSKIVEPLIKVGSYFAAGMLAIMMFLIFVEVAGRGLGGNDFVQKHLGFIHAIVGSDELTAFLMGMLVAFAIGYTALNKGHIRVDLLLQYVPRKADPWFDIFTYAFSFIFYVLITMQCWRNAWENLTSHASSSVLLIPYYPFMFLMVLGTSFLALVFLRDCLKSIAEVRH